MKRACVYNADKKTTRWEVDEQAEPRVLCIFADEWPNDFPITWYMPTHGLRVLCFLDPLHRRARDLQDAASDANLWWAVLDSTWLLNYDRAPWNSSAYGRHFRETAEGYLARAAEDDDLFMSCYGELAIEMGHTSADMGSSEHISQVFESVAVHECFDRTQEKVKWTRWRSWQTAMKKWSVGR